MLEIIRRHAILQAISGLIETLLQARDLAYCQVLDLKSYGCLCTVQKGYASGLLYITSPGSSP